MKRSRTTKLCGCGNRRRPKHTDCRRCHNERQRRYRQKAKQERERLGRINALLGSKDAETRRDFNAKFKTDWVEVVHKDGSSFRGLVVGYLPAWRVVVMDAAGDLSVAAFPQLQPNTTGRASINPRPRVGPEWMGVTMTARCPCGAARRPGQNDCLKCHRERQRTYREREKAKMFRVLSQWL